jgi:hypothetical protein
VEIRSGSPFLGDCGALPLMKTQVVSACSLLGRAALIVLLMPLANPLFAGKMQ